MEYIGAFVILFGLFFLLFLISFVKLTGFIYFSVRVFLLVISVFSILSMISPKLGTNMTGEMGKWLGKVLYTYLGYVLSFILFSLLITLGISGWINTRRWILIFFIIYSLLTSLLILLNIIFPKKFSELSGRGVEVIALGVERLLGRTGGLLLLGGMMILFIGLANYVYFHKVSSSNKRGDLVGKNTKKRVKREETRAVEVIETPYPNIKDLLGLLNEPKKEETWDEKEFQEISRLIERKLEEFKATGKVIGYYPGPVVTRYEFEPDPGVKISKIINLQDDLAVRVKASNVRVIAPLEGKGTVGIEVPNKRRKTLYMKELLSNPKFQSLTSPLSFPLGVDTAGLPYFADLSKMPHLLIAGATGSGKSVFINSMITSILFRVPPELVRFVLIDPKRIELTYYEGIPHLLLPVVKDREEAYFVLQQVVYWMDSRYRHLARDGVRDIETHNETVSERNEKVMPYIVVVIDEFADLILTMGKKVEEPLTRLAQMARAVGIHLVVATQRPSVDVVTGLIKANFPVRIAFKLPSKVDSRTILDEVGAEKLLGKGDMLFIPPGSSELVRLHGAYISEEEVKRVSRYFTKPYLEQKIRMFFPQLSNPQELAEKIIREGFIDTLTRAGEPGIEERSKLLASKISYILKIPESEIYEQLEILRDSYYEPIPEMIEKPTMEEIISDPALKGQFTEGLDPLIWDAAKLAAMRKTISATFIQRRLKVGFARAARILDQLEELGIVGPQDGVKPRKVLVTPQELELKLRQKFKF